MADRPTMGPGRLGRTTTMSVALAPGASAPSPTATTRLTGSNELVRQCGIEVAEIAYRRAAGLPVAPVTGYRTNVHAWYPVEDLRAMLAYRNTPSTYVEYPDEGHGVQTFPAVFDYLSREMRRLRRL